MKPLSVLVSCLLLTAVSGELITRMRLLQLTDWFTEMADRDQVYLMDIVAAAESCKLNKFIARVGMAELEHILGILFEFHPLYMDFVNYHMSKEEKGLCN